MQHTASERKQFRERPEMCRETECMCAEGQQKRESVCVSGGKGAWWQKQMDRHANTLVYGLKREERYLEDTHADRGMGWGGGGYKKADSAT